MGSYYWCSCLDRLWGGAHMDRIDLDNPNIMDAKEASKIWGHSESYVRIFYKQNPEKFPKGSIRKFGTTWVVTTEGMDAITGMKDPRKNNE